MRLPRVAPEDCETLGTQTAAYSRCDMNGHLNNTRYADIVCDAVPWQVWDSAQISDFIISYHREVPRGVPDRQRTPSILMANGKANLPLRHS